MEMEEEEEEEEERDTDIILHQFMTNEISTAFISFEKIDSTILMYALFLQNLFASSPMCNEHVD